MKKASPQAIHLKEYRSPEFLIDQVELTFDLDDIKTTVTSVLHMRRHYGKDYHQHALVLNGENLVLKSVKLNGKLLDETKYEVTAETLTINDLPDQFTLEIQNEINPSANKALEGLYKSGKDFCTQCEPEGFRRITYYLDRPDVMALFKTKIIGDKKTLPIMLSNGNPIDKGELDNGKHWVLWEDPFPKPAYLFALVAGDLGMIKDSYTTKSKKKVALEIYCDKGNEAKCHHAMESLKKSMKWDEERFGLEYDLDIYMIVAVDSFNMGAMENKGLNIFNSAYVLASRESATDDDFYGIESVIGHEYFHNWTGNRITCRDWFQLTLKEGLTVFRDQEFSADLNDRAVARIGDVKRLRAHQFVEDDGPTSHPIRPDSYIEINNFYTMTIYEKGAEVIRMVHTLLGEEGFRAGMDKYFELYDGMAVTTDDFIHAMSVANNNFDFTHFKKWYSQAGTPKITATFDYNQDKKTFTLKLTQKTPSTPGQAMKEALHMPFKVGLVNENGEDYKLKLQNRDDQPFLDRGVLQLRKEEEVFVFENISDLPVASLNREFSAPVIVHAPYSDQDLAHLMSSDSDNFNRFEAAHILGKKELKSLIAQLRENKEPVVGDTYLQSYEALLKSDLPCAFKALSLALPVEGDIHQEQEVIDYDLTFKARNYLAKVLASKFATDFKQIYEKNVHKEGEFKLDPKSMGERKLKNMALSYLVKLENEQSDALAITQFEKATNMTDELAALSALTRELRPCKEKVLKQFYDKWKGQMLVMQKWLVAQAVMPTDEIFSHLAKLENDPIYDKTVPNLVRSLVGAFTHNHVQFNHDSGRGYQFLADKLMEIDKYNPQLAARLAGAFESYRKISPSLQKLMKEQLERVKSMDNISKNLYEIVSKILGA